MPLASGGVGVYEVGWRSFLGIVIGVDVQLFHLNSIAVLGKLLGDLDAGVVGCQADQEDDLCTVRCVQNNKLVSRSKYQKLFKQQQNIDHIKKNNPKEQKTNAKHTQKNNNSYNNIFVFV